MPFYKTIIRPVSKVTVFIEADSEAEALSIANRLNISAVEEAAYYHGEIIDQFTEVEAEVRAPEWYIDRQLKHRGAPLSMGNKWEAKRPVGRAVPQVGVKFGGIFYPFKSASGRTFASTELHKRLTKDGKYVSDEAAGIDAMVSGYFDANTFESNSAEALYKIHMCL